LLSSFAFYLNCLLGAKIMPSSHANPYKVLNITQTASKVDIVKAVAIAMKLNEYPLNVIASAQKRLINTRQRLCADYLLPIFSKVIRFKRSDLSLLESPTPPLEFLPELDGINEAIRDVNEFFSLEMFG
jgi:hypothetical protein